MQVILLVIAIIAVIAITYLILNNKETLKKRMHYIWRWVQAIVFAGNNAAVLESIVKDQNSQIQALSELVNFLLANTNRFTRRKWKRVIDRGKDSGIFNEKVIAINCFATPTEKGVNYRTVNGGQ